MADILTRYGIKEVADVTFYELDNTGKPTYPVLFLDTLKVSTIEQTAESTDAKGGKGNAPLITWDYGKEINVTLEDALFSMKSMAMMFGNGSVKPISKYELSSDNKQQLIMRTERFVPSEDVASTAATSSDLTNAGFNGKYEDPNGKLHAKLNPKFYDVDGNALPTLEKGKTYFCTYDLAVDGEVVEISANSFPKTYYVTGDTYARSEASGNDEFFQFIIPKAKVTSENTITLEAEGDPSVFSMNLKVLRPADGKMMKLVKYDLKDGEEQGVETTSNLIHNHNLKEVETSTSTPGAPSTPTPEDSQESAAG